MKADMQRLREGGRTVVFTNGCFDILHQGHVRYLSQAKRCGDYLVIGLNSDQSVRAIKGPNRPLIAAEARAELLAALCFVDGVVVFDEEDPLAIIEYLKPQILVKGADWAEDEIIGAEQVRKAGGEVKQIPLYPGVSTSAIIRKIADLYAGSNA